MREGRNFQMMVYLRAAAHILAQHDPNMQVAGGLFWHIRNQQVSGALKTDDPGHEALEEAEAHIGRSIAAGRRGDFTVQPRKLNEQRCIHYCEFSQLCRTHSTSRYKPENDS
jgi:ATP-dependent helicase/DNAse subunit B